MACAWHNSHTDHAKDGPESIRIKGPKSKGIRPVGHSKSRGATSPAESQSLRCPPRTAAQVATVDIGAAAFNCTAFGIACVAGPAAVADANALLRTVKSAGAAKEQIAPVGAFAVFSDGGTAVGPHNRGKKQRERDDRAKKGQEDG
jgi:hypothetical protein